MHRTNIALSLILAALLAFLAWFWVGGTPVITVSTVTADAARYPNAFNEACGVIRDGTAPQRFLDYVPDSADSCALVGASLTVHNRGWFALGWPAITVEPASGDIAVYALTGTQTDIPAGGTGELTLRLLTGGSADTPRTLRLSWYVFGLKRTTLVRF